MAARDQSIDGLRKGVTNVHSMESYRYLLGTQMGENFSPTVYLDALKIQLGLESLRRNDA